MRDAHIALESTDRAEPAVNLKSILGVSTVALVGHSISCLSGAPYKRREKSAAPARGKGLVDGSHIYILIIGEEGVLPLSQFIPFVLVDSQD